jgi:Tfp pilus assembly protein PilW
MVGKAQKSHEARYGLYGRCSNGVPPISVSASIATFQSRNSDAPLRLLRHPKNGSLKAIVTLLSRSEWSVVRSASLAKGGTSKKRPSPHLQKVPTRSNKMSPRTVQTALECPRI